MHHKMTNVIIENDLVIPHICLGNTRSNGMERTLDLEVGVLDSISCSDTNTVQLGKS